MDLAAPAHQCYQAGHAAIVNMAGHDVVHAAKAWFRQCLKLVICIACSFLGISNRDPNR
jgi:hypothetical protein